MLQYWLQLSTGAMGMNIHKIKVILHHKVSPIENGVMVTIFVYFYSLSLDGALISVVSMVRRSSVMVSFLVGAMVFHEKNLRSKAVDLALVILGMIFLYIGTK